MVRGLRHQVMAGQVLRVRFLRHRAMAGQVLQVRFLRFRAMAGQLLQVRFLRFRATVIPVLRLCRIWRSMRQTCLKGWSLRVWITSFLSAPARRRTRREFRLRLCLP
nr:MAG TPA: hypothetical protein [Caudoviricetes sp.]